MNETLYSLGLLNTQIGFAAAGVIGYFFGSFLEKAGFGSSRRLTAIFYLRDMAVLKVMFTAVVTALVGYHYFVAFGWITPENVYALDTFWTAQIVGGLIFGIGFVVGGWCPGTAFVGLASAKWDALVFLGGAVIGSILFNEFYEIIQPFHKGAHAGLLNLPESLKVTSRWFPFLFSLVAVAAFTAATAAEKKFGGKKDDKLGPKGTHVAAAILLVLMAAGIGILPVPAAQTPDKPEGGILAAVAAAEEHIEPEELADVLMKGGGDYHVVDIRAADEYRAFHIRGAVSIPLAELEARLGELPTEKRIVLYSNGTTHAAQACLQLRNQGWHNVFVLTDGMLGFWRRVLTPPSLTGIADPAASFAAGDIYRARRAYFVDQPAQR
jgi:thiosulfate/3-mercaptopyruvate sulfurtransferase